MIEFILAFALFLAAHSIPARPAMRNRLVSRFGETNYLILYALLSLALLFWLISAAVRAPTILLWPAELWSYHLALALMLPASWLLVGGLATANPFSISLNRGLFRPERPGLVGWVRHPVLWGFALWALVHVIANGDLVALIMFGGFLLFAAAGMKILDRRKKRQLGADWLRLQPDGRRWSAAQLLTTFGLGSLLYVAALHAHPLWGPDVAAVVLS